MDIQRTTRWQKVSMFVLSVDGGVRSGAAAESHKRGDMLGVSVSLKLTVCGFMGSILGI